MKIAGQVERVQIEKGILFISDNHFSLALLFNDYFLYIGTSVIYKCHIYKQKYIDVFRGSDGVYFHFFILLMMFDSLLTRLRRLIIIFKKNKNKIQFNVFYLLVGNMFCTSANKPISKTANYYISQLFIEYIVTTI